MGGRLTGLVLVFPGLRVHEDLRHTVERTEDELVQHKADHDRLRTAVGRGNGQAGVEVEGREERFVVDEEREGSEGEQQVELRGTEQLSRVCCMVSFPLVMMVMALEQGTYSSTSDRARVLAQPRLHLACSAQSGCRK